MRLLQSDRWYRVLGWLAPKSYWHAGRSATANSTWGAPARLGCLGGVALSLLNLVPPLLSQVQPSWLSGLAGALFSLLWVGIGLLVLLWFWLYLSGSIVFRPESPGAPLPRQATERGGPVVDYLDAITDGDIVTQTHGTGWFISGALKRCLVEHPGKLARDPQLGWVVETSSQYTMTVTNLSRRKTRYIWRLSVPQQGRIRRGTIYFGRQIRPALEITGGRGRFRSFPLLLRKRVYLSFPTIRELYEAEAALVQPR